MLKLVVIIACISISSAAILQLEAPCTSSEPPPIPRTFSAMVISITPSYRALGRWDRSYSRQAASYYVNIEGGSEERSRLFFYRAENRTLYLTHTNDGITTCNARTLSTSSYYDFFDWLSLGQAECYQHIDLEEDSPESVAVYEVWSSIPKSTTDRIRVVEVDKADRTKIHRYSELKSNRDLVYTLEFLTFEAVEPDPSGFQVPSECF